MKAKYPNRLTQDKYITVLMGEYEQKYPEFSREQIQIYVCDMVEVITYQINEVESYKEQMKLINTLQSLKEASELDSDQSYTIRILFAYLGRSNASWMEEVIRNEFEMRGLLFPEGHKDRYLKFVSEITARVIDDICHNTTKQKSKSEKSHRERVIGSKSSRSKVVSESFVEQVGGRSSAEKADDSFVSKEKRRKKPKVSSKDEIPTKSK